MVAHAVSGWKGGWFVVPYQVMFRDVDTFGHVNNAVYFTYFEWARTLLWFELTGGRDVRDISFIVVRAECDFKLQLSMESIEIWVRIGEMRSTSFDFLYEIRTGNGQQIAAVGKVVVVLFDWKTQSKVAISDEFRRKVMSLQQTEG
ncbi:MAG TPA: thioesterase family protein [Thermoanaerobaculia bacterium]|jgi:acyl-CoA thioester hydrolase|nr:thioesterase family protein [Thermoanaerobaculia bacterium]